MAEVGFKMFMRIKNKTTILKQHLLIYDFN